MPFSIVSGAFLLTHYRVYSLPRVTQGFAIDVAVLSLPPGLLQEGRYVHEGLQRKAG